MSKLDDVMKKASDLMDQVEALDEQASKILLDVCVTIGDADSADCRFVSVLGTARLEIEDEAGSVSISHKAAEHLRAWLNDIMGPA